MVNNPFDAGNIATEEILGAMEGEISAAYSEAEADMTAKLLDFLFTVDDLNDARQIYQFFREQHKIKLQELKLGKISKKEYGAWKAKALMADKRWLPLQKTLADDLTHAREIATSIINDKKCDVYALNHNYATYEIEREIGVSTSFALYDHDTVERLIVKKPDLLPNYKVNEAKDLAWNTKHIRQAVTQGILQGESNQDIAKRLRKVCGMSENASIRTARTATTCAQNSGRIDGYKRAQEMGIGVEQTWISTLDGRTRHEHRKLMGQKQKIGKPFKVDGYEIMFPGDPTAEAFLVYNCRCTLIADVDGSKYNLEERIEEVLKKKDLTWDEWINEQPLPRHYGESKKDYLKRYKEHHKKMKFSDWLEEQVMPDVLITKAWSDKKMSNIYNLIKEQNVTDANKFYKELGKLGKPSEVWDKYLTGQLDAIDLKQFEEILKKYLPKETTTAAVEKTAKETATETVIDFDAFKEKLPLTMAGLSQPLKDELNKANLLSFYKYTEWRTGKISSPEFDKFFKEYQEQAAKRVEDLEKQIKYTKSDPMSFDDADMHHVNPEYKGNSGIYSKNCQTCAMTYEARRQGYNVEALGKDKAHPHTYALQQEVGIDQANAWINKFTGEKPVHLECSPKLQTPGKYKFLEDTVGHNGERYTLSVAWKGGGAHVINLDRDANGVLRLIDNQRGKNEKHIWTGEKEIKQYLDKTKKIKYVLRVDDCIPNPKYFNMITKESNTIKSVAKKNAITNKVDYSKLPIDYTKLDKKLYGSQEFFDAVKKISDKHGLLMSNAWKKYIKQDLPLDDMKKIDAVIGKFDKYTIKSVEPKIEPVSVNTTGKIIDPKKKETYQSFLKEQDLTESDIKNAGGWEEFKKKYGKTYGNEWVSKIDALYIDKPVNVLDKSQFKNKKMSAVYTDIKKTDVKTANQFYKELQKMGKPSDVWDKYLKGELPDVDVQKIEKHLQKKYSALEEAMPGESVTGLDIDALSKKKVTGVYNDFVADGDKTTANKFYNELKKIATTKGYKSQSDVWKKYLNGELDFDDIEKIDKYVIKKYQTVAPSAPGIEPAVNPYSKMTTSELATDSKINDAVIFQHIIKESNKYNILWDKYVTKWANGEIDDSFLDEKLLGVTAKKVEIDYNKLSVPSAIQDELEKEISSDIANEFMGLITDMGLKYNKSYMYIWKKYKKKELTESEMKQIDDIVGKLNKYTVKDIPVSSNIDYDKLPGGPAQVYSKLKGKVDSDSANEFKDLLDNIANAHDPLDSYDIWEKYKKQQLNENEMKQIDGIVNKLDEYTINGAVSKIDYDNLPPVTKVYSDLNDISSDLSFKFYNALNDAQALNEGTLDVWEKYKKKQLTKEQTEEIDKLVEQWQKYTSASTTTKPVDIKSKADLPDTYKEFLTQYDYSVVQKFDDYVAKLGAEPVTFYKKYKNGTLNIGGAGVNKILGIPITKADLPTDLDYIEDVFDSSTWQKAYDHCSGKTAYEQYNYFEQYVKGKIDDPELDKILGVTAPKTTPKPAPTSASVPNGQKVVDLDQLKNKKVTEIYNEIKSDSTIPYSAGSFYNELKKIGKDTGIGKQGDVWAKYVAGELDPAEAAKIDKYVIGKYSKIEEPLKFDKSVYQNKKMSNVYNELKAENVTNANQFYNYLKSIGKPSKVWQDYLDDKLIKEQADEIEKYLEKLSPKQKTKTISPTGSKLTPEQQKELDDAKKELEKAKAALPNDKKFSGIWKDEVGVSEYTTKKENDCGKKSIF